MTPEELKKFCAGEDGYRYYLEEPFSRGDYTYATNGHIIVRIPRIDLPENNSNKEAAEGIGEKAERLFAGRTMGKEFPPIPVVELPPVSTCVDCGGTGAEYQECDGELEGSCENCNGTGQVETYASTEVGNAKFQNKYLHMIAALPNSMIAPDGDNGAYFTFDGGDGLLMPTLW